MNAIVRTGFDSQAMLPGLGRWVACESPTHEAASVNRMIDIVEQEAREAGIAVRRIPGHDGLGDMLRLDAGPHKDLGTAVVLSHLDTVHPLGTLANDLPLRQEGDRLYGPGVYDMKGGAYLALQGFIAAARDDALMHPISFLFTPDEEIGSPISRKVIEEMALGAARVLVTEPARDGGKVVTARKGVGRFNVTITGRPAHAGARHEMGRSAIREAAHQILFIEGLTDYARGVTTTVGRMSGGTAANVIPRLAQFEVDLRVCTASDGEALTRTILGLTPKGPDMQVDVVGGMNRPPMERGEGTARLFQAAKHHAAAIGFALDEVPMTGGGSDGNFTAALGAPTLDGLGVDGDGAHTLQEYALISSLAPRAELMRRLLLSA
jgi:glutamate carboxypeptidase